ncbi:hypothetical protein CHR29_10020 [Pseudomonas monteilii]|uniref:DNA cytosine methyltransferase n=1 Tax=Pseudomonas TaxID=286 RepID=UPI000EF6856D|nr:MULTISPECIES: DNA cytosine methyltransferase [Pseudomonas]AYN15458.1 hypothetical protein CHR29_10020 [Pseudomonas monteilii]AYO00880.1 DNA cytosine methyltransferase [Pseudomonas sp. LTGT-11-2Z]AYO01497.1 DNA cytosine methyltransferase [Pseudomonas sp. LTGT-11-2Z]
MNELALFAGAGGGLLASHLLGFRTVCAVEHNAHAQRVLVQRQNDKLLNPFPIWDDVRTFDGRPWKGVVDLVSGGFPCQAFSTAAAGRNNAENLWPEMRRIVADVAPRLVFAENVAAEAIEMAAQDLRAMGYKVKAVPLSAADVGADHIRERYWLLAYADDKSELLRQFNAKMASCPRVHSRVWSANPGSPRMADGMANRMDRYQASGNGQVAIVAALAFILLAEQFV